MSEAIDNIPAPVLAIALMRACALFSKKEPEKVPVILRNIWRSVVPLFFQSVASEPNGKTSAAVLFLESYFMDDMDWDKMEKGMTAMMTQVAGEDFSKEANKIWDAIAKMILESDEVKQ